MTLGLFIRLTHWESHFVGAGHARDQAIRGHGPLLQIPTAFYRIIGTEENILPFRDSNEKQIEEERRLMCVGITRAERGLQISYCNRLKRGKDWMACEPGRFLEEMPEGELVCAGGHADAVPTVTKNEGMNKLARLKAMLNKPENRS